MAETTPDRLVAALTAAGWIKEDCGGEGQLKWARFVFAGDEKALPLVVPLNPAAGLPGQYDDWMSSALRELRRMAEIGNAADIALTEATCSCGGKRWVDDEGWQPSDWAMAVKPVREPGRGLLPCGNCNHGGWNVPVGDSNV